MRGVRTWLLAWAFAAAVIGPSASAQVFAPPPPVRPILPMERPAPTGEIMEAIDHCAQAVGQDRSLDMERLKALGWRTGASWQVGKEAHTEYLRGNIVNDVSVLPRAAGCTTKARLVSLAQIDEIRSALITERGLTGFDDFAGKQAAKKLMLDRFGEHVRKTMLFSNGNSFTIEVTQSEHGNFVAITNIPDIKPMPAGN